MTEPAATFLAGVPHVPQPSPQIHEGGDCFACAHLAIIRHFWPDAPVELPEVVGWWSQAASFYRTPDQAAADLEARKAEWLALDGPAATSVDFLAAARIALEERRTWGNNEHHTPDVLAGWETDWRLDVHTDPWAPLLAERRQPAIPIWGPGPQWEKRVEAYLTAGWVGYMVVAFDPRAPLYLDPRPDGSWGNRSHDHMVVLDGIRHYVQGSTPDATPGTGAHKADVHIMCSVHGGYWMEARHLLRWHGGMLIWWCRPRRENQWIPA